MPECRVSDVPSFLHRNCYERLVKFKDPKFEVRDQLRAIIYYSGSRGLSQHSD